MKKKTITLSLMRFLKMDLDFENDELPPRVLWYNSMIN
jgi:hypothetical protein